MKFINTLSTEKADYIAVLNAFINNKEHNHTFISTVFMYLAGEYPNRANENPHIKFY